MIESLVNPEVKLKKRLLTGNFSADYWECSQQCWSRYNKSWLVVSLNLADLQSTEISPSWITENRNYAIY